MKRTILFPILFSFFLVKLYAQQKLDTGLKGIVYDKETALDLRLLTHGWAADVYFGKLKTYYKTGYYYFGISKLWDAKEKSKSTDYVTQGLGFGSRYYIYGKQNYIYTLHGGWGMKRYYTEKAKKKGVAVAVNYSAGLIAGLLIPYYLDVSDPNKKGSSSTIRYTPNTTTLFLNKNLIRGDRNVFRGLGEASVVPGIHARAGVHLDWGAFDEYLTAVEVGAQLQIFTKKMPIMINEESGHYFFNLYVSLQIGKRK